MAQRAETLGTKPDNLSLVPWGLNSATCLLTSTCAPGQHILFLSPSLSLSLPLSQMNELINVIHFW